MTPFYFGSNFKMHQTPPDTARFVAELNQLLPTDLPAQLFLIPPFTSLPTAAAALAESTIWLGAQTMHWADQGAHTGEISAPMLTAVGVELIMLGHAERRVQFGETDETLRKKVAAAAKNGLRILLCVGENAAERSAGAAEQTVAQQLHIALADLPPDYLLPEYLPSLLIAYEPVWSIGEGGSPADTAIIAAMHNSIRATLAAKFSAAAQNVPILYGGSVNPSNCAQYAALPQVDGLFVGRAAWTPPGFVDVLTRALTAKSEQVPKSDS